MGCCCVKKAERSDSINGAVNPAFDKTEEENLHVIPEDQKPYQERAIDVEPEPNSAKRRLKTGTSAVIIKNEQIDTKSENKKIKHKNLKLDSETSRKDFVGKQDRNTKTGGIKETCKEYVVMVKDVKVNLEEKIEKFQLENSVKEKQKEYLFHRVPVYPQPKKHSTATETEKNKLKKGYFKENVQPEALNNFSKTDKEHGKLVEREIIKETDNKKELELNQIDVSVNQRGKKQVSTIKCNVFDILNGNKPVPQETKVASFTAHSYRNSYQPSGVVIDNIEELLSKEIFHIEQGFWSRKRNLIRDLKELADIEKHANKVKY